MHILFDTCNNCDGSLFLDMGEHANLLDWIIGIVNHDTKFDPLTVSVVYRVCGSCSALDKTCILKNNGRIASDIDESIAYIASIPDALVKIPSPHLQVFVNGREKSLQVIINRQVCEFINISKLEGALCG